MILVIGAVIALLCLLLPQPGRGAERIDDDTRSLRLDTGFRVQDNTQIAAGPASEAKKPDKPDREDAGLRLGVGDAVVMTVFGRPEFNTTAYVADDQTITVPLAGAVKVAGLSPADAALRVAKALRDGQYLVNPQVSLTLSQFRSAQVSVLGEVHHPGRFPIESRTTILDLLAQAGGVMDGGATTLYLIRADSGGQLQRHPVDLHGLVEGRLDMATMTLKGGDSLFIPRANQYYVYGEVHTPNMYRLEPGTTVVQAISRSGGITSRGSERRIEIKRRNSDGSYKTLDAELNDSVQPDDVIRVKERIF
ncbi:MAG TPA: polysaccharide biosynthesis/export family protein [Solimonas sp.]|nr:polysaccharide biosynthesis/export family protein [Solimonas sp.]